MGLKLQYLRLLVHLYILQFVVHVDFPVSELIIVQDHVDGYQRMAKRVPREHIVGGSTEQ